MRVFGDITANSQVWGGREAVATPMAQKDAEGWWEGAAKLLGKSLLDEVANLTQYFSTFLSAFVWAVKRLILWILSNPKSKLVLISVGVCDSVCHASDAYLNISKYMLLNSAERERKKNIKIPLQQKQGYFPNSHSSISTMPACRTCPLLPDSEPCSIMQRQRPHPTSPVPSKQPSRSPGCEIFPRDKSHFWNWAILCSCTVKPAEQILWVTASDGNQRERQREKKKERLYPELLCSRGKNLRLEITMNVVRQQSC